MKRPWREVVVCAGVALAFAQPATAQFSLVDTYDGNTYKVTSNAMQWTEAEALGVAHGGHLASVADQGEMDFLVSLVNRATGGNPLFWIGFLRHGPNASDFAWTDGSPVTYTNWAPGEPNNLGGEPYTHANWGQPGKWNDIGGGQHIGVVEIAGEGNVVPEPISMALLGTGLAGVGVARRRRKGENDVA